MSDTEQKTPNKTGASGAAWSDAEKIAYLIILSEEGGNVDAKIKDAPVPFGRSLVSCKKLLYRLNQKHKDDIEKIKAGQPLTATAAPAAGGDKPDKPKTPRKRKSKVEVEGEAEESPKKKATPRKKKGEAEKTNEEIDEVEEFKEEIKEENGEDEMEV